MFCSQRKRNLKKGHRVTADSAVILRNTIKLLYKTVDILGNNRKWKAKYVYEECTI